MIDKFAVKWHKNLICLVALLNYHFYLLIFGPLTSDKCSWIMSFITSLFYIILHKFGYKLKNIFTICVTSHDWAASAVSWCDTAGSDWTDAALLPCLPSQVTHHHSWLLQLGLILCSQMSHQLIVIYLWCNNCQQSCQMSNL